MQVLNVFKKETVTYKRMKKYNFIILRHIYNFISDFYNLFRSILNILPFRFFRDIFSNMFTWCLQNVNANLR